MTRQSIVATAAFALVTTALVAGAADAQAQQAFTPAGPLSQINGTPVKVGEHNEYYYGNAHRLNLSTNPVGYVFGIVGFSAAYAATDHVAIKGNFDYFAPPGSDGSGLGLELTGQLYLRRTFQGPFLEAGLLYRTWEDGYGGAETELGPQIMVGWHWMWDSGFNVAIAFGAARNFNDDNGDYYDEGSTVTPNGYLRFGYAF